MLEGLLCPARKLWPDRSVFSTLLCACPSTRRAQPLTTFNCTDATPSRRCSSRYTTMNEVPVETWTRIFALVCSDGGRMGCALSETCRYFRDAVLPVQTYSVALLGATKMVAFHGFLEARTPEHRRVQHLFLSQGGEKDKVSQDVLEGILRHVGPTLRTLTTLLPQDFLTRASVLCNPLPRLEELTMHGSFLDLPVAKDGATMQESFPSLKYLHFLSACNTVLLFIPRAPRLSHLRLSGIHGVPGALSACLMRALDSTAPAAAEGVPEFTTLERLIIVPDIGAVRIAQSQYQARRGEMAQLKARDKLNKLVIVEALHEQDWPPSKQAERRHWEERMQGGAGCWALAEKRRPAVAWAQV